jgi:site-specific DNA-adenine methylase
MENKTKLTPIYKWTGGKRKEIKIFSKYYPDFTKNNNYTYIEPFFGGGAVYWDIEANNYIINDIDNELINFLSCEENNMGVWCKELLSLHFKKLCKLKYKKLYLILNFFNFIFCLERIFSL